MVPIQAFNDNYIWCIRNQTDCVLVDPGDAAPVLAYCEAEQLSIAGILITHHHWDHTGGIDELLNAYPNIPVYGPTNEKITQINNRLVDTQTILLDMFDLTLSVMTVPGHTLDHIAYYCEIGLFCGDTLFSAGCGRLFEGTPVQMYDSLQKLASLPASTKIYCTHEYTLANIDFALAAEPNNQTLKEYKQWAENKRAAQQATLPSTLDKEIAINPFLRCDSPELVQQVQQHCQQQLNSPQAVFTALRGWKDNF